MIEVCVSFSKLSHSWFCYVMLLFDTTSKDHRSCLCLLYRPLLMIQKVPWFGQSSMLSQTWRVQCLDPVMFLSKNCFSGWQGLPSINVPYTNKWKKINVSASFYCVCSSKEDSLKDLKELASQLFSRTMSAEETRNAEADNRKKQQNKERHPNSNSSPLARFLLSRFIEVVIFMFLFFWISKEYIEKK